MARQIGPRRWRIVNEAKAPRQPEGRSAQGWSYRHGDVRPCCFTGLSGWSFCCAVVWKTFRRMLGLARLRAGARARHLCRIINLRALESAAMRRTPHER